MSDIIHNEDYKVGTNRVDQDDLEINNLEPDEADDSEQSADLVKDLRAQPRSSSSEAERSNQWLDFGVYMQAERDRLKLTQKDAALRAGIKTNTWWRLEKGKNGPQPETIRKIAAALDLDEFVVYQKAGYNVSNETIETTHETKQLGGRLRAWRQYRGQEPQVIADRLNIRLTEYLLYEAGTADISAVLLKKVAEIINVPTNDLLHEGPVLPPKVQDSDSEMLTRAEMIQWHERVLGELSEIKRLVIKTGSSRCGSQPEDVVTEV